MNTVELIFRRRNVRAFIKADLVKVAFVRKVKVPTSAGGWTWQIQPPLAPQEARIVDSKRRYADVHVNTEAGEIDNWPYILLGYHDMDVQENDTFTVNGNTYQVKSVKADNQERTVCAVDFYGP